MEEKPKLITAGLFDVKLLAFTRKNWAGADYVLQNLENIFEEVGQ